MNTMKANTKQRRLSRLAYTAGLVCLLLAVALSLTGGVSQAKPLYATAPGLGTAGSFSVLGKAGVTNTGNSVLSGKVGADSSITGFPPGTAAGMVVAPQVNSPEADIATADGALTAQAPGTLIALDLTGRTLHPGVYSVPSGTTLLNGVLTLDGAGVYIFLMSSDLTENNGSVSLIGGAEPCNVFWHVPTLATLTSGSFVGTIIAGSGVHFGNGVALDGRAFALGAGDVTLINDTISGPSCAGGGGPCATDGWPLVGEGFVNGTPTEGVLLRFNLLGWGYSYWDAITAANGWTSENKFANGVHISGATWVPNAAFSDVNYVLDRATVDGGAWNISGGPCTDLVVRVYIISKTSAVATAVAAGTPAAPILIPATGADLAGEQAFAYRQWMFVSLGLLGVCLALMGFALGRKPRG